MSLSNTFLSSPSECLFDIYSDSFHHFVRRLEADFPFLRITKIDVDGDTVLQCEHGGMRVLCVHRGEGEVWLQKGYRTQEGDGEPLPSEHYRADSIDPQFAETLRCIRNGLDTVSPKARPPVDAVLRRWNDETFCGDITGELWRLREQSTHPWTSDPDVKNALDALFRWHRYIGYSTKTVDSWERLMTGDQLVVTENEPLRVRGNFQCFSLEHMERKQSHVTATRRLRFILDTAGGCSPGFEPFRRLSTTWYPTAPGEVGDGINFFNSHVINIPADYSPTHFHPRNPIGGGTAQYEFYLVLDPSVYNLATAGLGPEIVLYPDLADLNRYKIIPLRPGMIVYIPPGIGHRGMNVFAFIMTLPGFKPGNDLYLDRDIYEQTDGMSPHNKKHLGSKNYERLESFL